MRAFRADNLPLPRLNEETLKKMKHFIASAKNLDFEIGAGVGYQAIRYAINNPERQLLSIERTEEKFEKFYRRWENHGRPANLFPVHADAISVIHYFMPPQKTQNVFFYYPNPESKNPTQRWINMPFMGRLIELLPRSAQIHFITNELFYFEEVKQKYAQWPLTLVRERSFTDADQAPNYRTHFEKKYLQRGQTCYEITLQASSQSLTI